MRLRACQRRVSEREEVSEDEMAGWHRRCNGCDLGQMLGNGEGQEGPARRSPWGCRVRQDWVTEQRGACRPREPGIDPRGGGSLELGKRGQVGWEKSGPRTPLILAPGSLHSLGIKWGCAHVVLSWSPCKLVRSAARGPTQTCPLGAGPPRSVGSGERAGGSQHSPTAMSRQDGPSPSREQIGARGPSRHL